MEIIDDLEREPRGVYGGGVGYYSWAGDADFAIVIRTATIEHGVPIEGDEHGATEDVVTVQAGAGIVADSVPESEYEETEQKMGGVLAALEAIETDGEGGTDDTEGEPVAGQEASR
jgi:anthranilate synthase component 1